MYGLQPVLREPTCADVSL